MRKFVDTNDSNLTMIHFNLIHKINNNDETIRDQIFRDTFNVFFWHVITFMSIFCTILTFYFFKITNTLHLSIMKNVAQNIHSMIVYDVKTFETSKTHINFDFFKFDFKTSNQTNRFFDLWFINNNWKIHELIVLQSDVYALLRLIELNITKQTIFIIKVRE